MPLILLESVGTFIDTDTGLTYSALANDIQSAPDWDNPVHIEDTTEEWNNSLSSEDIEILKNIERVRI
jgi:hypothetical protein